MPSGPVRRAQLVSPFGVGAITVMPRGISLMTAGLDHWFEPEEGDGDSRKIDLDEFRVEEWRLERLLGVSHFRQPPDYRTSDLYGEKPPNLRLTIPFVRFPTWHRCSRCKLLVRLPLSAQGLQLCPEHQAKGQRSYLIQASTLAMCDYGHIQDFPYWEWVHRSLSTTCDGNLRLYATGAATMANEVVRCDGCGSRRTMGRIMLADTEGNTHLSQSLAKGNEEYLCRGAMPWNGKDDGTKCGRHVRGALRSAHNVHFSLVHSSIYLPRSTQRARAELISLLEQPPVSTLIHILKNSGADLNAGTLRGQYREILDPYSDGELTAALETILTGSSGDVPDDEVDGDDPETRFRRSEFRIIRAPREDPQLIVRAPVMDGYGVTVRSKFERVMLVEKLRETRALWGFLRVFSDAPATIADRKRLLWRTGEPTDPWLPAYVVFGEGIFLEFDERVLQTWERQPPVVERIHRLSQKYAEARARRRLQDRDISPRFVLVHTLGHMLINALSFEAGYTAASLRERVFVSANPSEPMAGLLIYTADGDSEGTLGGLVRTGKAGSLEKIIARAIDEARWCSADPVCMEIGGKSGQGPDSCNLAACHRCALVSETSCEFMNRFLDRAVVVGELSAANIGFFSDSQALGQSAKSRS